MTGLGCWLNKIKYANQINNLLRLSTNNLPPTFDVGMQHLSQLKIKLSTFLISVHLPDFNRRNSQTPKDKVMYRLQHFGYCTVDYSKWEEALGLERLILSISNSFAG